MRTAREVNLAKQNHIYERIRLAAERLRTPRIALLGMSYKANIDDLRESPSVQLAEQLAENDVGDIFIVEPNVEALPPSLADNARIRLVSLAEAIRQADVIALLVAHDQFHHLERAVLQEKMIIDAVGLLR